MSGPSGSGETSLQKGIKNMTVLETAETFRDQGNDAVKSQHWQEAIDNYTQGLQLTSDDEKTLRATLYRNRSLARLKNEDYEGAEADATKALEFDGIDTKALFRRALAREQLDNIGPAFRDAQEALRLSPKDKAITELAARLFIANSEKVKKATSMDSKVSDMSRLALQGGATDADQKLKAFNNLLVLARETETGAQQVWKNGEIIPILMKVVNDSAEKDEIVLTAVRIIDDLCKNHKRALQFLKMHNSDEMKSVRVVCRLLSVRDNKEFCDAAGLVVQRMFNALVKMDKTKEMKPDPEVAEANKLWIIRVILEMQEMLTDKNISAIVRETVIDLFLKNLMHMDGGIPRGWSWKFTEDRGLLALLDVSAQIPEQCDYPVSHETRQHLAICLARLHDDMVFDTKRAIFKERVDLFMNNIMSACTMNDENGQRSMIKLANFLITMLQGPVDVGINLVTNDQVTAIMMTMAGSDNHIMQSVAAELIVQAVSKHERATNILKVGFPVLRKLYNSEDENVKVRALVGLCKCGAAGGDDISRATMEESQILNLAKTCKKFLLDYNKYSVDVRRFACEGLSYLSLDADVKEWIVNDPLLLQALFTLAKSAGALCVYTLASIYVNLTNAYDKPEVSEEMVKLAQFSKHHVPETHPKDTDEYVEKRVRALVDEEAVSACVAVSKTQSTNAMELLARAILAFTQYEDLRGKIIKDGGLKLCLHLCKEATPEGKIKASHAIARLGIKADPQICFAGQRAYEVVKPLVDLLHPDIDGKPNYDALMTLTNLASMSDSVRNKILKEKTIPKVEEFWFMTDHAHLRAAAAELLLNMLFLEEFYLQTVQPGTDKLKLWTLYAAEEDERLAMASSAAFSILTEDEGACKRIMTEIGSWTEVFTEICMHEVPEVQRRGLIGITNIMNSDKALCAQIIATDILRVLVAITKLGAKNKERAGSTEQAQKALNAAEKWELIKATDRELYERTSNISTIQEE